jgi:hypothetical protein
MRLDNQRRAFDHSCVGALATFAKSSFDQRDGIGERRHAAAGVALSAEIVLKTLAICGLCEHPGECVLSDSARPREKQRAGNTPAPEHATKSANRALIAKKCVKADWFFHAVSF